MGDRCYLEAHVHKEDLDNEYWRGLFLNGYEETRKSFVDHEASYAMEKELKECAEAGVRFFGHHSNGHAYPARMFYSDGEELHAHECVQDGGPYVEVSIYYMTSTELVERIHEALQFHKSWSGVHKEITGSWGTWA